MSLREASLWKICEETPPRKKIALRWCNFAAEILSFSQEVIKKTKCAVVALLGCIIVEKREKDYKWIKTLFRQIFS